ALRWGATADRMEHVRLGARDRPRHSSQRRGPTTSNKDNPQQSGISRRTVARAMAWPVPVIAVARKAPAVAASPPPVVPEFNAGTFCKHPGNPKYYHVLIDFTNNTGAPIEITLGDFTVGATARQAYFSMGGAFSTTATIPVGTSCLYVDAGLFDN